MAWRSSAVSLMPSVLGDLAARLPEIAADHLGHFEAVIFLSRKIA